MPAFAILLLVLPVILIWGANFAVMRIGVGETGPFTLAAMRFLIASLPFLLFVSRPRLPWGFIAAYAASFGFGQFAFLFWAIHIGLPSGMASLLVQLQAVFTPLFALAILGQRIPGPTIGAILTCLLGLTIILSAAGRAGPAPLLLGVLAAMSWGASNVVIAWGARNGLRYNPVALVIWASALLPLPFLVLAAATGELTGLTSGMVLSALPAAIYLGLIATVIAYHFWVRAISTHGATAVAPFSLLIPIIGLALGSAFFGETLGPAEKAGCALILAGILLHILGLRTSTRMR